MEIIFGMKHAGFNYKKQVSGIKLAESANLGDAIQDNCKNLVYFFYFYLSSFYLI
jgi:hypothetical protein